MHPRLLGQIADEHVAEMRQSAAQQRASAAHRPAQLRVTLRSRAGWTLIAIGLRIAVGVHN